MNKRILIYTDTTQTDYSVQEENGWLVVPVVMMTEGVRHGSAGPVLHLEDYYSKNPQAWNGAPVTAGHPLTNEGEQVSVNSVSQEQWVVGHLRNAHVEDGKLKATCYIDRQRAIAINPEVVNYISEGKKLEVSIGAFTEDAAKMGTHDGEDYERVTMSYHPDHLALLPGERGACSWQDGCGIRNNKANDKEKDMEEYLQDLKEKAKEGKGVANNLQDNQIGFMEISRKIQNKLDRMDSDIRLHFLQEVFDNHFVYKVRNRDSGEESFFQLDYSITDEEEIQFEGEPSEVRREVEFVPMQSNKEDDDCGCKKIKMKRTNFNKNNKKDKTMSEKDKGQPSSEVMTKVVGLVNNEQTRFGESDQDWLLNLTTNQLTKLEPKEPEAPEVTREQAIQALEEDLGDVDKVKELVTNEVKEKIETGLNTYDKIRENLVNKIQNHTSEEDWPAEELQDMETKTLQKLEKSVRPVDYSGQAPVNNADSEDAGGAGHLLPAGINAE